MNYISLKPLYLKILQNTYLIKELYAEYEKALKVQQ